MLCRSQGCGTEGLFHKTDGYCPRCYEELDAFNETHNSTGYYARKDKERMKMLPYLFWIAILTFILFIGRALWLMIFE